MNYAPSGPGSTPSAGKWPSHWLSSASAGWPPIIAIGGPWPSPTMNSRPTPTPSSRVWLGSASGSPPSPLPTISLTAAAVRKPRPTQNASSVSFSHGPTATRKAALSRRGNPCGCPGLQGLFILSSFPRRRESMWSCHEKFAIGHGHVGSRFRGKDETRLTQSGK